MSEEGGAGGQRSPDTPFCYSFGEVDSRSESTSPERRTLISSQREDYDDSFCFSE